MAKKQKGWSFFKVIIVLGFIVAVAVFILDRILPKPYEDDLDDAWNDETDFENEEDAGEEEIQQPPTADVAYDMNEDDVDEEEEKKEDA